MKFDFMKWKNSVGLEMENLKFHKQEPLSDHIKNILMQPTSKFGLENLFAEGKNNERVFTVKVLCASRYLNNWSQSN